MSLLTAGTLFAQFPTLRTVSSSLKPIGINLSLWKGISTQADDSKVLQPSTWVSFLPRTT